MLPTNLQLSGIQNVDINTVTVIFGNMKYLLQFIFIIQSFVLFAQENYEIQVYASPTQSKNSTIFESHTNFTFLGQNEIISGVLPSNHSIHETIEITTGITNNFELGAYLFTNYTPGYGYQVVGTHIRPRVTAPSDWGLPFGLSLSLEVGYQKAAYSEDIWSVEIRPIIDKNWDKFYASFNPTFGIALAGINDNHTPVFQPNIKLSYQFFKKASFGLEYYGSMGYVNHFENIINQSHSLYAVYDLTGNNLWEVNIGVGYGLTDVTDKWLGKIILGRRINWKK